MNKIINTLLAVLSLFLVLLLASYCQHKNMPRFQNLNPEIAAKKRTGKFFKWFLWDRITGKRRKDLRYPDGYNFEVIENDAAALRENKERASFTFIGHATVLIQLDGKNILTDPNYSDSVWTRQRITRPGIAFDNLPPIDIILISHNHYDHLDADTIKALGPQRHYFVPMGLKNWFAELGITQVQELNWWKSTDFDGLKITFVPAQHFSKRGVFDANTTAWGGWVVEGKQNSFYFAGDTGYFPGFAEIGKRFPGIDVAMLPIGAYEPAWFMQPMHVNPEEALQAFADLRAKRFIPIHWGTFKMSDEFMDEPLIRLNKRVEELGISGDRIWILKHGETRFLEVDGLNVR